MLWSGRYTQGGRGVREGGPTYRLARLITLVLVQRRECLLPVSINS